MGQISVSILKTPDLELTYTINTQEKAGCELLPHAIIILYHIFHVIMYHILAWFKSL